MVAHGNAAESQRRGNPWHGQASDLRRQQVRARGPVAVPSGPTGPTGAGSSHAHSTAGDLTALNTLWGALVDVLGAVGGPSYALLSTPSGFPLKAYGYDASDLVTAARAASGTFEARRAELLVTDDVAVVEVVWGGATQSVIAGIASGHGHHLLSVTADGVSMPVLRAWVHHTAGQIRTLLA